MCDRERRGMKARQKDMGTDCKCARERRRWVSPNSGFITMHLSQCRRRSCCQWQRASASFSSSLCLLHVCLLPLSLLLSHCERTQLNTSACLSSLWPRRLQTLTQCRQEKSIIASLGVTIYLPHHLALSLANSPAYPALPATAHKHQPTRTVMG